MIREHAITAVIHFAAYAYVGESMQYPEKYFSNNVVNTLNLLDAMKSWSRTENLPEISCPTLIIWGEADRTYRWPQIEELWTAIPESSLSVLPGCSHAAHMEKPELFNHIVRDFLVL